MPCAGEESSADEIEITPAMIEAGLEWLYAYNPERSLDHDRDTVKNIIKAALATAATLSGLTSK